MEPILSGQALSLGTGSTETVQPLLDMMGKAIEEIRDREAAFADVRHEIRSATQLSMINGTLRRFDRTNRAGTVARVLVGECWGQASTTRFVSETIIKEILSDALRMAKLSARYSRKNIDLSRIPSMRRTVHQKIKEDPSKVSDEEKLSLVIGLDKAQKVDERIVNTTSNYMDTRQDVLLANSVGSRLEWDEVRVLTMTQSVAKESGKMQFNYAIKDGQAGFELMRTIDPSEFAGNCAQGAVELLSAAKPPSGEIIVVTDSDVAGLIAHEVCGHASEADEVVKGRSFLTNMTGKQVASEQVTLVDDGTIQGLRGTIPFDSEGSQGSRTAIINHGRYEAYLHTLETSSVMNVHPTGNGRAQDYNHRIFARMTNTYFDKGEWKNDEIIADTKDGLYVIQALSGMEDVVGGGVQCSALKGYIIKNGELGTLVRSMSLAGKVLDFLKSVDAVGDTLGFVGGTCGKGEEDFVPVSTGGPHMRARIVVGGG
jgi:TldD protein